MPPSQPLPTLCLVTSSTVFKFAPAFINLVAPFPLSLCPFAERRSFLPSVSPLPGVEIAAATAATAATEFEFLSAGEDEEDEDEDEDEEEEEEEGEEEALPSLAPAVEAMTGWLSWLSDAGVEVATSAKDSGGGSRDDDELAPPAVDEVSWLLLLLLLLDNRLLFCPPPPLPSIRLPPLPHPLPLLPRSDSENRTAPCLTVLRT